MNWIITDPPPLIKRLKLERRDDALDLERNRGKLLQSFSIGDGIALIGIVEHLNSHTIQGQMFLVEYLTPDDRCPPRRDSTRLMKDPDLVVWVDKEREKTTDSRTRQTENIENHLLWNADALKEGSIEQRQSHDNETGTVKATYRSLNEE